MTRRLFHRWEGIEGRERAPSLRSPSAIISLKRAEEDGQTGLVTSDRRDGTTLPRFENLVTRPRRFNEDTLASTLYSASVRFAFSSRGEVEQFPPHWAGEQRGNRFVEPCYRPTYLLLTHLRSFSTIFLWRVFTTLENIHDPFVRLGEIQILRTRVIVIARKYSFRKMKIGDSSTWVNNIEA